MSLSIRNTSGLGAMPLAIRRSSPALLRYDGFQTIVGWPFARRAVGREPERADARLQPELLVEPGVVEDAIVVAAVAAEERRAGRRRSDRTRARRAAARRRRTAADRCRP